MSEATLHELRQIMDENLYGGREQSRVKHLILQRYLLRFALIIGRKWKSITYVDCFSGPWKSQSESYEDTSFAIAIQQLRDARTKLARSGIKVELRAFFIERNRKAFSQLQEYVEQIDDVEIETRNSEFEDCIDEIRSFISSSTPQTFPFIFIDPTGWSGFTLDVIQPLLSLNPCEVLINFMTQHIIRLAEREGSQASFERLFGSTDFRERLEGTNQEDRVDAAVFEYRDVVSRAGKYEFPGVAGILNPLKDRSHFHLIYLSRHWMGLNVFKDAEKKSMEDMEKDRARVEQSRREAQSRQPELFPAEDAPESDYFQSLRDRYLGLAFDYLDSVLLERRTIEYDAAWNAWLRFPMVWESDLKGWIKRADHLTVEGLSERQRVPQRGKNNFLQLRDE
jgi:three-Cys-motif partner protein